MITLEKVLGQAIQLPLEQQRVLANILQHHCHSVKLGDSENKVEQLDFRNAAGLGEEIWKDIQVEDYIRMERNTWD